MTEKTTALLEHFAEEALPDRELRLEDFMEALTVMELSKTETAFEGDGALDEECCRHGID